MNLRRVTKKEFKLKSKPWIDKLILKKNKKRDKLLKMYLKSNVVSNKSIIYDNYKIIRNEITKLKRESKKKYYKDYFERNNKSRIYLQYGKV